ncbi:MAG: hypothetical protein JWQ09_663 [Segetibacter sp.]|nr:hypothetical protein [Segetibacter sp.]
MVRAASFLKPISILSLNKIVNIITLREVLKYSLFYSMIEFTKESIERAIEKIDLSPELTKGRESKDYDLVLESGKKYPPILVLSEAHKILGGEQLVINNFNNATRKPFKILRDLGYNVVLKNSVNPHLNQHEFDYKSFLEACSLGNLLITEQLAIRFISALITKPFVILTGLSGSGKTKLALAFAQWITNKSFPSGKSKFIKNEQIKSDRVTYSVTEADAIAITLTQSDSKIKVTLPYELINDWVETIRNFNYSQETPARTIRESVREITKFSSQINSFESHLKAAAFQLMSKDKTSSEDSSAVCLLAVGADWTNREPLLGYPNALEANKYVVPENGAIRLIIDANNNPTRPYFLILDEMNLSHVERYFADFLSAMESKEPVYLHSGNIDYDGIPPSISLPDNLFIIGTVNIDETTYMFSPKVLDRASVIEFRVDEAEMESFLAGNTTVHFDQLLGQGVNMAEDFLEKCRDRHQVAQADKSVTDALLLFFAELKQVGAEFGYRTASEILRFVAVTTQLNKNWTKEQILDAAIMQKLLPKLHGSRRKLEATLKSLVELCLHDNSLASDVLNPKKNVDFRDNTKIKFPISLEKIRRMNNSLIRNNFTSYAEA